MSGLLHQDVQPGTAVYLHGMRVVFWDFDGVIKESVEVKALAFERLFLQFGEAVAARVRQHHEANGGVSRFDKIPLYLGWAGEAATASKVKEFVDRFSLLVRDAVVRSAWVPGVREYLEAHHACQVFVLVSATPQQELSSIIHELQIACCFKEVYGFPASKSYVVGEVLRRLNCQASSAILVGDSDTDLVAARNNNVPFLLRRTAYNRHLQEHHAGYAFEDLAYG